MKMVMAMIKPERLDAVMEQLKDKEINRLTVLEVKGFGQQLGQREVYRGQEFDVKLRPKVQLEIAVNDEFVQTTVDAIVEGARTPDGGAIGDGKVFVLDLNDAVKVRTGESGAPAI